MICELALALALAVPPQRQRGADRTQLVAAAVAGIVAADRAWLRAEIIWAYRWLDTVAERNAPTEVEKGTVEPWLHTVSPSRPGLSLPNSTRCASPRPSCVSPSCGRYGGPRAGWLTDWLTESHGRPLPSTALVRQSWLPRSCSLSRS